MSELAPAPADYQHLLYEEQDRVALISFNRPASRNAWNVPLVREVIAAVQRANASEAVRVIVITGEGPVYSAGADIKAPPEPKDENGRSPNPSTLTMGRGEYNWLKLLSESKPNIVAVNGPAIGLGATHILSADIRIAAQSAFFSFPFLRLGAMPECGATALLGRLIGFGRAMDLSLRAGQITADEALHMGLVTAVYPDDALRDAALAMAAKMAEHPPLQMKLSKKLMWENAGEYDADEIMRRESKTFVEMLRAVGRAKPLG
jgi:2-(1,2-epoxy-1,2-dihydrophenyl)acetyl-CoA isomerase